MGVATLGLQDSKSYILEKFRKAKSYFNNFCVAVVKNGRGILLGHGILIYVPSQD